MITVLILATTFLSAFLLFVVQPLYAKFLLPFFGGTSSVWTISIFFYSVILLLGYSYAAQLVTWPARWSRLVHTGLLIAAGGLLLSRLIRDGSPLLLPPVTDGLPAVAVLLTLLHVLGLPVLLLASTSIIMQHLYALVTKHEPYALFALSNAGSLLGLLAYPLLLEPFTTLTLQSVSWLVLFVAFLVLLSSVWRQVEITHQQPKVRVIDTGVELQQRWLIVALAAIPTFLLAAGTEFFSKGIASFPLLWIIPLALYLVSFIFAFGRSSAFLTKLPLGLVVAFSFLPVLTTLPMLNKNILFYWLGFLCFMGLFFLLSLYFHRRVYAMRPAVRDMGIFYIYVTLGGAIGSGIVGFLLPFVLDSQIELPVALAILAIFFSVHYFNVCTPWVKPRGVVIAQGMMVVYALIFLSVSIVDDAVAKDRNFYGALTITDRVVYIDDAERVIRQLNNGNTNHGFQVQEEKYAKLPGSYYGPGSGIAVAISSWRTAEKSPRVLVVGLGSGVMSTYCDDVLELAYVEINPMVEKLAREHFSFLLQCPKASVTIGDGRLVLEGWAKEAAHTYDIIMIDAFTDDAIPTHLLTEEAFRDAYNPLLSEQGIVSFHVSNRYLNLLPPIAGLARSQGYNVIQVETVAEKDDATQLSSSWVLLVKPERYEELLVETQGTAYNGPDILWTDNKNSVLSVLSRTGSKLPHD